MTDTLAMIFAALVIPAAMLVALWRRAEQDVERRVSEALDDPEPLPQRIARVVFQCRVCRHITQETAADLDAYLTALETGTCDSCRAALEAMEEQVS